ncbi:hypothetical protein [Lysobacter gummosus]|uniref:hypothetical protein n=1 Tax=Lysobacter gummosus TaxID=262324 RepID=UPI003629FBA4
MPHIASTEDSISEVSAQRMRSASMRPIMSFRLMPSCMALTAAASCGSSVAASARSRTRPAPTRGGSFLAASLSSIWSLNSR